MAKNEAAFSAFKRSTSHTWRIGVLSAGIHSLPVKSRRSGPKWCIRQVDRTFSAVGGLRRSIILPRIANHDHPRSCPQP
ncbi:MAG: hypothetical protein ACRD22_13835, partial [Terriglobia bacterium]